MKPAVELLLRDAHLHVRELLVGLKDDYSVFLTDESLRESILWNLANLGEALNQAANEDNTLEATLPALRSIAGLRNRFIHGYRNIDKDIVWIAASLRLPELQNQIESVLTTDPETK